jgi:hypothetical protein
MSCILVLLMAIVVVLFVVLLGVPLPLLFIFKGGEVTRKVTESITT